MARSTTEVHVSATVKRGQGRWNATAAVATGGDLFYRDGWGGAVHTAVSMAVKNAMDARKLARAVQAGEHTCSEGGCNEPATRVLSGRLRTWPYCERCYREKADAPGEHDYVSPAVKATMPAGDSR